MNKMINLIPRDRETSKVLLSGGSPLMTEGVACVQLPDKSKIMRHTVAACSLHVIFEKYDNHLYLLK
jgi:hypothetical protein